MSIQNNDFNSSIPPGYGWLAFVGVDDVSYAVPEPASVMLLGTGHLAAVRFRRKIRRSGLCPISLL